MLLCMSTHNVIADLGSSTHANVLLAPASLILTFMPCKMLFLEHGRETKMPSHISPALASMFGISSLCASKGKEIVSTRGCYLRRLELPTPKWLARANAERPEHRRSSLPKPAQAEKSVSLWSIIKDVVGKDLTRVCLPVYFNERLSALQRTAEDLEYSELVDEVRPARSSGKFKLSAAVGRCQHTIQQSCQCPCWADGCWWTVRQTPHHHASIRAALVSTALTYATARLAFFLYRPGDAPPLQTPPCRSMPSRTDQIASSVQPPLVAWPILDVF